MVTTTRTPPVLLSSTEHPPGEGCPLVLVDDEEFVLSALRRVLRSSGFRVHTFVSPEEALTFIAQNEVHVVVCDFRMPGMDGVELLRRVRELQPIAQRVMLTGYAEPKALEEAVNRTEVFRFVTKPWDDHAFQLTIRAAADEYHTKAENLRLARITQEQNEQLRELTRTLEEKVEARTREIAELNVQWGRSLDAVQDPIAVVSAEGDVRRSNRAFAERFGEEGRELAETVAQSLRDAGQQSVLATTLKVGARTYQLRAFPSGTGEAVCSFHDVTDQDLLERRLRQHEKMVAMGQLAGGVAHEINSPLAGILTLTQLLLREARRSPQDVEILSMIEKAARRAARIVDSLLRFARMPQEAERQTVDVGAVVEDAVLLLSAQLRGSRVTIRNSTKRGEHALVGSSGEIHQVLLNLLRNAQQALGEEGGAITVAAERRADAVVVSVADNGPGIAPEILERIFEPFFTTKPEGEGTGLGLAICYRIIESHGGRIEVESEPGVGTTFRLVFPATRGTTVSPGART